MEGCCGWLNFLGKLGKLYWFRCQGCGLNYHKTKEQVEDSENCCNEVFSLLDE